MSSMIVETQLIKLTVFLEIPSSLQCRLNRWTNNTWYID
jgi:hypothetical protein